MGTLRFSIRAEADLLDIGAYTLEQWGLDQAARYLADLESCCTKLAGSPALGRPCDDIWTGIRRIEHGKHVIFYRHQKNGDILVVRILHQRMLPERRLIEDEESDT